jgi:putative ABC transport system permease protein
MNFSKLILRSVTYHARSHLGVVLGAAIGSAILVGALLVGGSVKTTLHEMAMDRLGTIDHALVTGDRLFREQLAVDLADDTIKTSPVLLLPGTAVNSETEQRANRVQIIGVNSSFWSLANEIPDVGPIGEDHVVLNEVLAAKLGVKVGDEIVLRVPKLSSLSRDAPMAPQEDTSTGLRLEVKRIVNRRQLGRFSLQANQIPPLNAFLSLARLQERVNAEQQANVCLLAGSLGAGDLDSRLQKHFELADADLQLRQLSDNRGIELRSPRVFLDVPVVTAAEKAFPDAQRIQTYFVNGLRSGENVTPYSMITAAREPLVPAEMQDDEIILNKWAASDLNVGTGDEVSLTYHVVGAGRKLIERTNTFRVKKLVPMSGVHFDAELMPDFPGMTDAETCQDWDTGFAIDRDQLRTKDQDYWDKYRGTPKGFITAAAGAAMWANRFGEFTSVRIAGTDTNAVAAKLLAEFDPATIGFGFQPMREQALAAGKGSQDFGGLFIGFSFFLIVAALVLVSMLFQFGVEQRAKEVGTLLAIGFPPAHVRKMLLWEGVALAAVGSAIGLIGAVKYAQAMLFALSTVWRNAVGTSEISYHSDPGMLAGGFFGAVIVAGFSIWLALRKQVNQPARELLADEDPGIAVADVASHRGNRGFWIGIGSLVSGLGLTGWAFKADAVAAPGAFFGAGALLLIAALSFTGVLLSRLESIQTSSAPSLVGLGLRNATRRRRRSMATATMLACGCFLVLAIGSFRLDENLNAVERSSGTGGFALIGETATGISFDLNTTAGREHVGLADDELPETSFVQIRMKDGDDASCLNLNAAQRPRILGVDPAALEGRKAFSFAKALDAEGLKRWDLLRSSEDDAIPAIADNASIMWAMKSGVGKIIEYPDPDEQGRPIRFRLVGGLANSVLQGSLLIDEAEFARRFPSIEGYRMFLIDAPAGNTNIVPTLNYALRDDGLELTKATARLAQFNAVQNTYLGTFQILGGLGLLLGSAGLGVVVLRNVLERRQELAVMLALGFKASSLRWLVVSEHTALLLLGLGSGIGAAVVAVIPALQSPASDLPYGTLIMTLVAVLGSGIVWTWLASVWALRGKILDSLRNS